MANKLGMTRDWVRKRAKRLRKAGVDLPHFIRHNPYFVDFQKLNALYRAEKERAKSGGVLWEWQVANESRPKTRLRLSEYRELMEAVAVLASIDVAGGFGIGDEVDEAFRSWVQRVESMGLEVVNDEEPR